MTEGVTYGLDIPGEADLRLLGDLRGKRVLELGCGLTASSVAFARGGARPICVDASAERLGEVRRLASEADVKVEVRQGDLADLAFLRADTVDAAFSAWSFQHVEDLGRVLRQVHRVLKVGAPLVFSLPHPAYCLAEGRSYFDRGPQREAGGPPVFQHTFSDLYMGLSRTSFRVDAVLEPEPLPGAQRSDSWTDHMERAPRTLVVRARKEGH